jgi:peptide/nickel transport system permease protein
LTRGSGTAEMRAEIAVPSSPSVVARRTRIRVRVPQLDLWLPVAGVVFMLVMCFLIPLIVTLPPPSLGNLSQPNVFPLSPGHLLGTDSLGNDVFSRVLYGGRISMEVGFGSVGLGLLIGGSFGIVAGYFGGFIDAVIMRCLDVLLAFPALVLALSLITYLGPNERDVIFAIAVFTVPADARLARAGTLQLRELPFIVAARIQGEKKRRVILTHILPNVVPQMMTFALVTIAVAMIAESALSFLGLGINPPTPSWGSMIASGQVSLATDPYLVLIPGAFLFFTVLCFNLLGDALRRRWA